MYVSVKQSGINNHIYQFKWIF